MYYIITLFLACQIGISQNSFIENELSDLYSVKITVAKCEDKICSGKGSIKISSKTNPNFSQSLTSENLHFYAEDKNTNKIKKSSTYKNKDGSIGVYKEDLPVAFEDYNFDGNIDVAIRNGNNSGYGGPSFDIYVYNITKKQFVLSKELTELASTNLGMFQIDKNRKRIITNTKSGCCWHSASEYEVVFRKGLQLVTEIIEDATIDEGNYVLVTEKNLVNNKWQIKKKRYKTKDYYKE
ncbi:MAG: hypothetical protein IPL31_05765 [Saprospiraceae bacterium]|nr:hypothetical protein [Saprospiraceae bacterium]